MITINAMKVLNKSQIVVLVLDSFNCFEKKDSELIQYCIKEGRGLIVLLNKFDLLEEKWH